MTPYFFKSISEAVLSLMLKSGLVLLVLLGLYRWLLENQPMHRLKRVYLLGTLLLSLVAVAVRPLITIEVPLEVSTASAASPEASTPGASTPGASTLGMLLLADVLSAAGIGEGVASEQQRTYLPTGPPVSDAAVSNVPESGGYWLWLYGAGTLLMLARFTRNLYVITRQVTVNPTQPFRGAMLVRLPSNGLPYTFLHYLFVPDSAYQRGEIEGELFVHELTHIRQRHSLDVLLVEIVICFGWFNPLLFWLKRVMQLNHEFLADEAVNTQYGNVAGYQHLLLSKLTIAPRLSLTSTLTFQTTKQRLLMMTKQTSPARTWLAGSGIALLFVALTALLSTRTVAQQNPASPKAETTILAKPAQQPDVAEMERQFGDKMVNGIKRGAGNFTGQKKFRDLTPDEKKRVLVLRPDPRKTPTEAEWKAFHNQKKYGIWVDEKRRRDNPLAKYKRTDIVSFWSSYVYKNARQPEGYTNQLELYTEAGYQKTLREWQEKPWLHLITTEQFERQQKARAAK